MDVDGVGDELIDKMIEAGLLHDVADFYLLDVDAIAALDTGRTYVKDDKKKGVAAGDSIKVGTAIATKVMDELIRSKEQPLSRVLFALGIRHVGKSVAEVLAKRFLKMCIRDRPHTGQRRCSRL